jgi:hypothetical protein
MDIHTKQHYGDDQKNTFSRFGILGFDREGLKRMEKDGIMKGRWLVSSIQNFPWGLNMYSLKTFLGNKVLEHQMDAQFLNASIFNFGIFRVRQAISNYPAPPLTTPYEFSWYNVPSFQGRVLIPGYIEGVVKDIEREIQAMDKVQEILMQFRRGGKDENDMYSDMVQPDVERDRDNYFSGLPDAGTIFKRIMEYGEVFFPCSRSFERTTNQFFIGSIFSRDYMIMYVQDRDSGNGILFSHCNNSYDHKRLGNLVFYIRRFLGQKSKNAPSNNPFVRWADIEQLQRLLPVDAVKVEEDNKQHIFVSKETKMLISVVEEKLPAIRMTIYPFEFVEKMKMQSDPLLEVVSTKRGEQCM